MIFNNFLSAKNYRSIFLLIFILLVAARFLYLDQDTPFFMIAGICQEDEVYYAWGGVNQYNADQNRLVTGFEHIYSKGLLFYSTHPTYITLHLFGNNFWGLRLPAVLVSILIIYIISKILKIQSIEPQYRILLLLYLLTDFSFFIMSRFQSPQIYSILAITIILWLYFKKGTSTFQGLFLLGFFSFFAVCFVYLYNFFLLAAVGTLVLINSISNKKPVSLIYFFSGIVACVIMYIVWVYAIGSSISEIVKIVTKHGGGVDPVEVSVTNSKTISEIIKIIFSKIVQLPLTNLFRYNISILFLFLISLPFVVYRALYYKDKERYKFYLLVIFFLVLQTTVVTSYPFRKLIVVLPVLICILAEAIPYCFEKYRNLTGGKKLLFSLFVLIALAICLFNYKLNNDPLFWSGFKLDHYENVNYFFNAFNLGLLFLVSLFVVLKVYTKFEIEASLLYGTLLLPGILLTSKYCFLEKKYDARDGLKSSKELLENKVVIGAFAHAYQFYTNCKPALDKYGNASILGDRYSTAIDSMIANKSADFYISKVIFEEEEHNLKGTVLVKKIPMKFYSYYIYKTAN